MPEEEDGKKRGAEGYDGTAAAGVTVRASEDADLTHQAARPREEKLRSDLFVLHQLAGAFAAYNDVLRATQASTVVTHCPSRRHVSVGVCRPATKASREAARGNRRVP